MKKVLFLIHDLGPGGAEKVLVNLLNNMDRAKFDISLIALFGGGVNEQFLKDDIRYTNIFQNTIPGNSKLMKVLSSEVLHRLIVREHYDIEVSYLEGPSARLISGCRDTETKLVSWIHGEMHTKQKVSAPFRSYAEAMKCYQRFDRVIFVSETVKNDFSSLIPDINIGKVLYNTIETNQILELRKEPVDEGLFLSDEIKICGVGRLNSIKAFDRLVRIHVKLVREGFKVHTYLLGEGPDKEAIENYVDEQNVHDSFTLLGYQTNPYKYVGRCDLFVCTSISEGFSTAATEALILGTAVVTTPVSGMKEMLGENNDYGIVAEEGEEALYQEVRKLVSRPKRLNDYKKKAEERGKFFSTEKTVRAVEEMFESL